MNRLLLVLCVSLVSSLLPGCVTRRLWATTTSYSESASIVSEVRVWSNPADQKEVFVSVLYREGGGRVGQWNYVASRIHWFDGMTLEAARDARLIPRFQKYDGTKGQPTGLEGHASLDAAYYTDAYLFPGDPDADGAFIGKTSQAGVRLLVPNTILAIILTPFTLAVDVASAHVQLALLVFALPSGLFE